MRMTFRSCKEKIEIRNQDSCWTRVMFWGLTEKIGSTLACFQLIFSIGKERQIRGGGGISGARLFPRNLSKVAPPTYWKAWFINGIPSFCLHVQLSIHKKILSKNLHGKSVYFNQHWATETETEHCENIHVSFHATFIFCMFSTIWTRQDVLFDLFRTWTNEPNHMYFHMGLFDQSTNSSKIFISNC